MSNSRGVLEPSRTALNVVRDSSKVPLIPLGLALVCALSGTQVQWTKAARATQEPWMCQNLPEYDFLDAQIPRDAPVVYLPGDGLDRQRERFFCVRFALAPRLVVSPEWKRLVQKLEPQAWLVIENGEPTVESPRQSSNSSP